MGCEAGVIVDPSGLSFEPYQYFDTVTNAHPAARTIVQREALELRPSFCALIGLIFEFRCRCATIEFCCSKPFVNSSGVSLLVASSLVSASSFITVALALALAFDVVSSCIKLSRCTFGVSIWPGMPKGQWQTVHGGKQNLPDFLSVRSHWYHHRSVPD
jgi:hypothetical protein